MQPNGAPRVHFKIGRARREPGGWDWWEGVGSLFLLEFPTPTRMFAGAASPVVAFVTGVAEAPSKFRARG